LKGRFWNASTTAWGGVGGSLGQLTQEGSLQRKIWWHCLSPVYTYCEGTYSFCIHT